MNSCDAELTSSLTSPVVLPTVSYQKMRHRQRWGVKLLGECSPFFEQQRGWELGLNNMANESELLINVVKIGKLKLLISLNQNGKWSGSEVAISFDADVAPPAERQSLNCSWYSCGTW